MAAFRLVNDNLYEGLSTDTKPTTTRVDMKAKETDTGDEYVWNGSAWVINKKAVIVNAGTALIGKVGIDQTTPGTTNGVQVNAALPAGANNIGDVDIALTEMVRYPFGKGLLTTDGVQYSAEVVTTDTNYKEIEKVTINQPSGYTLDTIELSLTGAVKSSGATKYVKWKFQISDNGTDWVDLIAEQTRAADASTYADVSIAGRFAPVANALLAGTTFQIRFVIQSETQATETATGKAKNSSYIITRYRRS